MKLRLALVGLVALGGAALTAGMASAMPLAPLEQSRLQTLRALLWSAVRMVVSAQHPSTDGTATASVAMVMACVEVTHTIAAIAVGNLKGGFGPPFPSGQALTPSANTSDLSLECDVVRTTHARPNQTAKV
jgi:hypothetical protein